MPADTPPVPADCHVGVQFSASAITAATSKRCKLLGQGACGRVTAAEYPAATPAPAPAGAGPSTTAGGVASTTTSGGNNDNSTTSTSTSTTNYSSSVPTNGSSSSSVLRPRRVAIKTALPSPGNRRSLMVEAKALAHTAHPAGAVIRVAASRAVPAG